MTAWVLSWLSPWLASLLYFAPLTFCHVFYLVRTVRNWQKDRAAREVGAKYDAQMEVLKAWRVQRDLAGFRKVDSELGADWWARNPRPSHPEGNSYKPTDTVGTIVGRVLVSWLPVANLWAALFDLGPEVFGRFFRWIGKVFDQPLVPK